MHGGRTHREISPMMRDMMVDVSGSEGKCSSSARRARLLLYIYPLAHDTSVYIPAWELNTVRHGYW